MKNTNVENLKFKTRKVKLHNLLESACSKFFVFRGFLPSISENVFFLSDLASISENVFFLVDLGFVGQLFLPTKMYVCDIGSF